MKKIVKSVFSMFAILATLLMTSCPSNPEENGNGSETPAKVTIKR